MRGRVLSLPKYICFSQVVYTGSMMELEKNHLKESSVTGLGKTLLKSVERNGRYFCILSK